MRRVILVVVIGLFAAAGVVALGIWSKPAPPDERPEIPFPIGKETTVAVGPLDKNGYVDYEAALNERMGKGITPEKNANVLLWKAFGPRPVGGNRGMPPEYFEALGIDEPPTDGNYCIDFYRYMKDRRGDGGPGEPGTGDRFSIQLDQASKRPWSAKDFPQIAAWLASNEKPLSVVHEATKRPEYFNPMRTWRIEKNGPSSLLGSLLPNVQKNRELASTLCIRAMLRVNEGKMDETWQDLLACHRLARLLGRGACLIEYLVAVAIEQVASTATLAYLDRADLSAQQAIDRLKEMQSLSPMPSVADKIDLAERFMYLDCAQMLRRGGIGMLETLSGGSKVEKPTEEELKGLTRIDWEPMLRDGNKWYDRMTAAGRAKTREEREKLFDQIDEDLKALKKEGVGTENLAKLLSAKSGEPDKEVSRAIGKALIGLMLPATRKVQTSSDRCEQIQRNLQLAFALHAFQKDTGKYPAKLGELAPKYLATVPDDIFSGKPLIYRLEGKGYLLYSFGPNGKDDNGRWLDDDPPGDDPNVRMPLPELKKK